ncbi:MAG: cellulase, partial [Rubrivivax sp.]
MKHGFRAALLATCLFAAGLSHADGIALNQLGYPPGAAKVAAVPAGEAKAFRVVDAKTGKGVLQGPLGAATRWELSGQDARLADFSALKAPGRYRLQVDGLPDSAAFEVATNVYAAVNAASIKAFYYNRASTPLLAAHAGQWARPAGHPDDRVLVHASAANASRPEGTVISAPRGWYDAGDYNKYIVNSGITVYTMLAAWEHYPALFKDGELNIPESGNGLPDLLDEVLWNLEWMLAMQDPADGGVYHKLTNKGFDGVVMPADAKAERYVVQKGTTATLDFAAVMAQASRVFAAFEKQKPGLSARMLDASKRAWDWAQAHPNELYKQPPDIRTGGYGDKDVSDEFAWAGTELFVTTGDARYKPDLAKLAISVPGWPNVNGLAWTTLAHHRARLAAADNAAVTSRVAAFGEELTASWRNSPYRVGLSAKDYEWGSTAVMLNRALMLIQAYRLQPQP